MGYLASGEMFNNMLQLKPLGSHLILIIMFRHYLSKSDISIKSV